MPKTRHPIYLSVFSACATLGFAQNATTFDSSSNVAVYWGQNSYGLAWGNLSQQRLSTYCADTNVDIIPMAFLTQLRNTPSLNFANSQNDCPLFPGTSLIDCSSTIGEDIKTCQQQYGKKILLSIGGATYTEGGFSSADEATAAADNIWAMFGPAAANTTPVANASFSSSYRRRQEVGNPRLSKRQAAALRPFGDAVLDGFDFDFESTVTNMVPFASRLRTLMDGDASKQYYFSAAPQCPYPDLADNELLSSDVKFDAVFVQFYNNPGCASQAFVATAANQTSFDFSVWNNWAKTVSANKDVKVFLGVPANTGAAGTGYLGATALKPVIDYSKTFSNFGGVMMWDMSQAYANEGFLSAVKSAVMEASTTSKRGIRRTYAKNWRA